MEGIIIAIESLSDAIGVDFRTLPLCLAEAWTNGVPALKAEEARKCIIALAMVCRDRNIAPEHANNLISNWSGNNILTANEIERAYNSDEQLTCVLLRTSEYISENCEKDYCDYNKWRRDFNFVKLENRKKEAIKNKFAKEDSNPIKIEDDSEKKESLATQLANLARKNCVELWHTSEGSAYITLYLNGHKEYKRLDTKSTAIKAWLSRLGSDFLLETPSTTIINAVITLLEGVALYDGKEYELFIRKAESGDKIYIDIGDSSWKAIEISKNGWKVIDDCPIKFRRPKSLLPLPIPVEGGDINDFKSLVNASDEDAWIKYTAWLSQAFWCRGPFVHLHIRGPQGSAKSAMAETTKNIIDPSRAPRRHLPSSPRELMMACHNEAVPSFDNVSDFADDIADTICIISTGGSSAARELYTDADEALIYAKNPIIMNGIADPSQRGDLLDRLMILDLDSIPEDKRVSEKEMRARLDEFGSKMLGVLLDATVTGLLNIDNLTLKNSPRMADFASWAISCSPVFGWKPDDFISRYQTARAMDQRDLAEGNRLMMALKRLEESNVSGWSGTATELLDLLNKLEFVRNGYEPDGWPRKAQDVGTAIRRLVVSAQSLGIGIRFYRSNGKNLIEVKKMSAQSTLDDEGTLGIHSKIDSDVGSVSYVSFSRKIIEYRKNTQVTQNYNNKKTFGFEPTLPTLPTPIAKSECLVNSEATLSLHVIYILREIPSFVGIDGWTYGPLQPDEVVSLPVIHANNLVEKGFARIVSSEIKQ